MNNNININKIHCDDCNKDIRRVYYKKHCATKSHKIKTGEITSPQIEDMRKSHILTNKAFPLYIKKNEIRRQLEDLQIELFEAIKGEDKYWMLRDIKHYNVVKKGDINFQCLICLEKRGHFMRTLLCCNNPICFDCLIQCDKCPFCRKIFA
jgi:hypothetical protein